MVIVYQNAPSVNPTTSAILLFSQELPASVANERADYESLLGRVQWSRNPSGKGVGSARCPLHTDHKPSLSIFRVGDHLLWKCHACGKGGSLASLALLMGRSTAAAPRRRTNLSQTSAKDDPRGYVEECVQRLRENPAALEKLRAERMIDQATAEALRYGLTQDGRYVMMATDPTGRHIVGVKSFGMHLPKDSGHRWRTEYGCTGLFGADAIAESRRTGKQLVIVEGENDCAAGRTAGLNTVSHTGGAAANWTREQVEALYGLDVVILYDNDEAGRKGAEKLAQALEGVAVRVRIAHWPQRTRPAGHDLTDELRHYPKMRTIRGMIRRSAPYVRPSGNRLDWSSHKWDRITNTIERDTSLPDSAKIVWAKLAGIAAARNSDCAQIPYDTLASMVGKCRRTIINSIRRLEEAGYLDVNRDTPHHQEDGSFKQEANWYRIYLEPQRKQVFAVQELHPSKTFLGEGSEKVREMGAVWVEATVSPEHETPETGQPGDITCATPRESAERAELSALDVLRMRVEAHRQRPSFNEIFQKELIEGIFDPFSDDFDVANAQRATGGSGGQRPTPARTGPAEVCV